MVMEGSWVIGVAMNVGGSVGASAGLLVQKKAAQQQEERINQGLPPFKKLGGIILSPLWLLGFCLLIFIPVPLDFFAYKFVAQSLVAPLGALSVVFTMVLAPFITKEIPTKVDFLGAFMILGGCAITTASGSKDDKPFTLDELRGFFVEMPIILLFASLTSFAIVSYVSISIAWIETHPIIKKFRPMFFAFISGYFGAINNVALKCASNLISIPGMGSSWIIYLNAFIIIFCSVQQISWLNKGLEFFDGIIFLPVYNTALIILTAATGSVFYEEYKSQSLLDLGIFVIGCLVACAGVMVIAFTEAKPQVSASSPDKKPKSRAGSRPATGKNSDREKSKGSIEITDITAELFSPLTPSDDHASPPPVHIPTDDAPISVVVTSPTRTPARRRRNDSDKERRTEVI